jgi:hypothetical protein
MKPPEDFQWPPRWRPIADEAVAAGLLAELRREVSATHCLFGRAIEAIARRADCDDVLFTTDMHDRPLAVVHLTWRSSAEPNPTWPHTEMFATWNDWRNGHRF